MTNQAIHGILCLRWRLVHILPAIAHVAGGAAGLVGDRHAAKTVDHLALAQYLPGFLVVVEPGPVGSPPNLLAGLGVTLQADRKSTRLNSSHVRISYAVFCL